MAAPLVLTVPADPSYVVVLRAATAAAAGRAGFGLDQVEDLRLAVDELAALALAAPHQPSTLSLTLELVDDQLNLRMEFAGGSLPEDGFAWLVLSSLVSTVQQDAADGRVSVLLTAAGGPG